MKTFTIILAMSLMSLADAHAQYNWTGGSDNTPKYTAPQGDSQVITMDPAQTGNPTVSQQQITSGTEVTLQPQAQNTAPSSPRSTTPYQMPDTQSVGGYASVQDCIDQKKCNFMPDANNAASCKSLCQSSQTAQSGCGMKTQDGKYSGTKCAATDMINAGAQVANMAMQTTQGIRQVNAGTAAANALTDKAKANGGMTISDSDNSQADVAKNAAKLNEQLAVGQGAIALYQGVRAAQHFGSAGKATKEIAALQAEITANKQAALDGDPNAQAIVDRDSADLTRMRQEAAGQQSKGTMQAVTAAMTAKTAADTMMEAANAQKMAASLQGAAAAANNNAGAGFYGPGGGGGLGPQDQGLNIATPTPVPGGVIDPNAVTAGMPGSGQDFNPNTGNGGVGGPTAQGPVANAGGPSGGAPGAGLGGAGGTSASKDTGDAKQDAPAGKGQTGGQYASGDGGSPKFARGSGGGAGVGADPSIADLLKGLLPGNDKKDAAADQASLDLNARGPASDQAAVLGRNQNIFLEISKRYKKKNQDGAVIFSDHG